MTLVESKGGNQKYEIVAGEIEIYSLAPDDFPLQKKKHTDEYLRTIAHLRPRTNKYGAAFRVRSELSFAIHKFFNDRGFRYVHTPIITGSDCEGAGEMFQVTTLDLNNVPKLPDGSVDYSKDFFGKAAHLTVSGQLNGEMYALGLGDIYTFGPTFRAENSNTTRHAAEFWMIEPEMAFADIYDDMDLAEDMVRTCVKHVMDKCPDDLALFDKFVEPGLIAKLQNIVDNGFARITYAEAIDIMKKSGHKFEYEPKFGIDMQTEHERYLAETHFKRPVIVRDYPKEIVPQAKILESAKEHHAEFIALSALMTTTMQRMREIVAAAKEEGITAKIIIGGAVITQEYADEIGADGYSKDAADAVKLAKSLM